MEYITPNDIYINISSKYQLTIIRMSAYYNNTAFLLFSQIDHYAGQISVAFQVTEDMIINTLTSLWTIHLIIKLIKSSRTYKLEASLTFGAELKNLKKEYVMMRNKSCILLAICFSELLFAIIAMVLTIFGNHIAFPEIHKYSRKFWGFPFNHLYANKHLLFKVMNSALLTSFMSMMILIRITTQYMYTCYSYFKQTIRLKYSIAYLCLTNGIIFILGMFNSYSILVQSIIYQIILMVEFVLYVRYTIKLVHCLYKRYFDSRHHEFQSHWVINYYKRAHISFKFCSISLTIGLFCHIATLSIVNITPQVYFLVNEYLMYMNLAKQTNKTFLIIYKLSTLPANLFIIFGCVFLIIPYVLFSLGYLYTLVKRSYRFRMNNFYSNPSLINRLLQDQNSAYRTIQSITSIL